MTPGPGHIVSATHAFVTLGERMATHSSILAWRIAWTEEPGGLQTIGSERVRHKWSDLARMHVFVKVKRSRSSGTDSPDHMLEPARVGFLGSEFWLLPSPDRGHRRPSIFPASVYRPTRDDGTAPHVSDIQISAVFIKCLRHNKCSTSNDCYDPAELGCELRGPEL